MILHIDWNIKLVFDFILQYKNMTVLVYPTHNHILSAHTVTTIAEKQVSHTQTQNMQTTTYI